MSAYSTPVSLYLNLSRVTVIEREAAAGSMTYLEPLVGFLATRDVLARVRDYDDRDLVVVAAKELLCSANNVSDYDGGSEGEDDVLVVRMQNQSPVHLACREEVGQTERVADWACTYP